MGEPRYPCPCCGYLVFDQEPGSYGICPICFWEDDLSQLRFVRTTGANHVTLIEAQRNFARSGASEERLAVHCRKPTAGDRRDESWRPFNPEIDLVEEPIPGTDYGLTYHRDCTVYYYWRNETTSLGSG
jgi:hypothetical protein